MLVGGCAPDEQGYFPLARGMRWQYAIDIQTVAGAKHQRLIVENLGLKTLAGAAVSMRRSAGGSLEFLRETPAGIELLAQAGAGAETRMLARPQRLLGYPPQAGTRWSSPTRTQVLEKAAPPHGALARIEVELELQQLIESTEDTVVVPAGRFERCLRVKGSAATSLDIGFYIGATDIRVESTQWYAPGVGLVKALRTEMTSEPTFPRGEYRLELVGFER